jgi:hypothetical protein
MDRFLIADNPMNDGSDIAIIHTVEPISIIGVIDGHANTGRQYQAYFNYGQEKYTLYVHHMFSTNMAGLDEEIGGQMVNKLLKKAFFYFAAYLQFEDKFLNN